MNIINNFKITIKFIFKVLLLNPTIKIFLLKITIKVIFFKINFKIILLIKYLALEFNTFNIFLLLLIQRKNIFFKFIFPKINISKIFISEILYPKSLLKLIFKNSSFKLNFLILFKFFDKNFLSQIHTLIN
jgi:hypothetical protein